MSKPKVSLSVNDISGDYRTWTLHISRTAMVDVNLDAADRRFLVECEGPDATIADKLLALQTLVFRIEQQSKVVGDSAEVEPSAKTTLKKDGK